MGETEAHFCLVLIMAESIPSVSIPPPRGGGGAFVGHLSFCFGKAANAPRSGQMFIEKPTVGLKNRVQIPNPGTTPKLHFPAANTIFVGNLEYPDQTHAMPIAPSC